MCSCEDDPCYTCELYRHDPVAYYSRSYQLICEMCFENLRNAAPPPPTSPPPPAYMPQLDENGFPVMFPH